MSIPVGAPATGGRVLAPSRSTVYISNLPFSLTNNDLTKVFEKFGKIVRVTVVRNKETHKSKGVAFMLFLNREEAQSCVKSTNGSEMFGRTLKASIAKDNGRAPEFIKRREYPDKSRLYEIGENLQCTYYPPRSTGPNQQSTTRALPRKDDLIGEKGEGKGRKGGVAESPNGKRRKITMFEGQSLTGKSQCLKQELRLAEEFQSQVSAGEMNKAGTDSTTEMHRKIKIKKSTYFSDEEELSDI
ncbi:unnamed protein product, partial [Meganyctiphanes norvegica]